MIGRAKQAATYLIGQYRRSAPVRMLHSVSAFIESAYDNEGSNFYRNGELALIRRLAPAGFTTAFDVGANIGDWTVAALEHWNGCRVHAFEVAAPTFEDLRLRMERSGRGARATINACGMSNHSGDMDIYFYPEHPDITCDRPRHGKYAHTVLKAPVCTGAEYMERHGIGHVDFLKIDVEGAEHTVLEGFSSALTDGRIHSLQFEYGVFAIDTKTLLCDYHKLLQDRYWIGKIYPTHVEFADYRWELEDFRFANYYAVSKDRSDLRKLAEA